MRRVPRKARARHHRNLANEAAKSASRTPPFRQLFGRRRIFAFQRQRQQRQPGLLRDRRMPRSRLAFRDRHGMDAQKPRDLNLSAAGFPLAPIIGRGGRWFGAHKAIRSLDFLALVSARRGCGAGGCSISTRTRCTRPTCHSFSRSYCCKNLAGRNRVVKVLLTYGASYMPPRTHQ